MASTAAELTALAAQHRRRILALSTATALAAIRRWKRLTPAQLVASWDGGGGRDIANLLTAGQLAAAQGASPYVAALMAAQDLDGDDDGGELNPEALAGIASDGRSLSTLLFQTVADAERRYRGGATRSQAMAGGQAMLERIARTQVTDAGRVAAGTAVAARAKLGYYVRTLTPPSCARCAILGGKVYRSEIPFARHPHCDCQHLGVGDPRLGDEALTSPEAYFESLSTAGQDMIFGKAASVAIREGADPAQVVNARRGMEPASVYGRQLLATTEGTTRRGFARSRLPSGTPRLMPEAIMEVAADRAEMLRLLRRHGYLT